MNPPLRVSRVLRRHPYAIGCVMLTVGLTVAIWFLRGIIAELEEVQRVRARQGEAMFATLVGGLTQRQELAHVREATRRIDDNLLVEANLAENLWYFYKLEEQTKVRLPELHQLNSPPTDASPLFRRIPYTLRVTGSYDQVAAFLLALETGPRLVSITGFTYARRDATGNMLSLDMDIELLGKK